MAEPVAPAAAVRAPVVAIIGGGFTGAATAYHLARKTAGKVDIAILEPRRMLGTGLAYSAPDRAHRINVPDTRMALDPEHEGDFSRWLDDRGGADNDPQARMGDGRRFPARALFGRYVDDRLRSAAPAIRHLRSRARQLVAQPRGWLVMAEDGTALHADIVVIATSHPPPQPPQRLLAAFGNDPKFVVDPWCPRALAALASDDRVLIVGTGLTMADVVASLAARGHRGAITAISRRGQRSRGHAALPCEPRGDFATLPETSALGLLRRVRAEVAAVQAQGDPWQAVFDQLRVEGGPIWQALPLPQQRRLIRHLRPFWDTHRFRISPQTEAVLDRLIASRQLDIHAASLVGAERRGQRFGIAMRLRGGVQVQQDFDAVIVTTGPGHGAILRTQPFLAELAASGALGEDPTGLGLPVDAQSRLLGTKGAHPDLFVAGPLARGRFGELMGLPEVTHHAVRVADEIARLIHR